MEIDTSFSLKVGAGGRSFEVQSHVTLLSVSKRPPFHNPSLDSQLYHHVRRSQQKAEVQRGQAEKEEEES